MVDLSEPVWVAIGTIIGGIIGGGAQIFTSRLRWKREAESTRRQQRAQSLYALQDRVVDLQNFVYQQIVESDNPIRYTRQFFEQPENSEAIRVHVRNLKKINIRVGDVRLGKDVDQIVEHLHLALEEGSLRLRKDHLDKAENAIDAAGLRIKDLLHRDVETDLGVERPLPQWETAP